MKTSQDRILTTHVGSLPRPPELKELLVRKDQSQSYDKAALDRLTDADLKTFHKDGTRLPGHPPTRGLSDVLFATGSLGHGLSLAAGLALAKKLRDEPGRVFCLLSDGEWRALKRICRS